MNKWNSDKDHKEVYKVANDHIRSWLSQNLEEVQVLKECSWMVDSMVVLNTAKNRAILSLIIQDDQPKAELDYVYLLYAAKEGSDWQIYFAGMPNIVYQRDVHASGLPIPINKLSALSRAHLSSIYYDDKGRVINDRVNKLYTADLLSKNKRFIKH